MQDLDQDDTTVKFSDFYIYQSNLGSGGFGRVVQALNQRDQVVAVKIIPKSEYKTKDISKILAEANILASLKNPNIVQFKAVKETDTKILIEMALVKHGQLKLLFNMNTTLDKLQRRTIMKSIFQAVEFIHSHGVVHRDLKPENILIEDPQQLSSLKIVDFGLSTHQGLILSGQCGTLIYMAPELFTRRVYSKPVDIWSCGIILYMVCTNGEHPLYKPKDTMQQYKEKLLNEDPEKWYFPPDFDPLAKNLFLKCIANEPMQRYTANQVLQHPWITGNVDDPIPLTMPEMCRSFTLREEFIRIIKAIMFLRVLKKVQLDKSYISKCKRLCVEKEELGDQSLLEKDYVKEMFKENIKIKQMQQDSQKIREQPKYEIILKRIKENTQNNIPVYNTSVNIQSDSSSLLSNSEQSMPSYNKITNFNDDSEGKIGKILIKKQFQTKKKCKKIKQLQSAKKAPSTSIDLQVLRSRSTTTNHKLIVNQENEVRHFESPNRKYQQQQQQQQQQQLFSSQVVHLPSTSPQHQRKQSVTYDARIITFKQRSNASTRKLSVVEKSETNEVFQYEQEKVVHSMFMPRGYSKKFQYQRNLQQKYLVPPHLLELNALKPNKAQIEQELNDLRIHDLSRTKPPLPMAVKKLNQLDFLKKK